MHVCRLIAVTVWTVCLMLAAAISSAQESADWYYNKPIKFIEFDGLVNIKKTDLDGITSSYINKEFTDDLYSELLSRLYALDYFESIEPVAERLDENSIVLRFVVTEKPIVSKINFAGNRSVRSTDLQNAATIKVRDVFNESKLLVDERAIRDVYLKRGFTGVRVSSSYVQTDKGVEITFMVNEGKATVITSITFQGNQVYTERTLRGKLTSKAKGILNKGAFQESQLELDRQALETYYHDNGYADAAVLDIVRTTTYNAEENQDELSLEFIIQEGNQYTFGGISFVGNSIFSTEELRALVRLDDNTIYNQTRLQAGMAAVADLYYENGYTSNNFIPDINKNADMRSITATLTITEGPRSHIENIIIEGNTKTKDYVILRELLVEPGDIYSKAKIERGLRNLLNLQYFSAVVPQIAPGSEATLSDLVITVEEQSTMSMEFGLTFSGIADPDAFPISLFVKWQDSNVAGTGRTLSAGTVLSTDQQSVNLGYGDSWLLGIPLSFSVGLEYAHKNLSSLMNNYLPDGVNQDDYYFNYEQHSVSFSAGVGHRWMPAFAIVSVSGGLTTTLLSNIYDANAYEPYDSTIAEYQGRVGVQNSIYAAVALDNRDINYDPSKGWFIKDTVSWYGLIPKVETEFFFRNRLQLEGYVTLLDWAVFEKWSLKFVLAAFSTLDTQLPIPSSKIGINNQLYIDGMFIGRGWNSIYNKRAGRGMMQWNNIVELRMPIVPGILAFDFFFDAVAMKDTASNFFTKLTGDDFYFSFGPGFRFSMPQFPLRLLFAFPFKTVDGQVRWLDQNGSTLTSDKPQMQFVLSFNIVTR